eukprot:3036208-Rhodomonas_salina.1
MVSPNSGSLARNAVDCSRPETHPLNPEPWVRVDGTECWVRGCGCGWEVSIFFELTKTGKRTKTDRCHDTQGQYWARRRALVGGYLARNEAEERREEEEGADADRDDRVGLIAPY